MRHGDKVNNLGRKKAHRKALLSNLASQLIVHKRIVTSLAKAKALRTFVEPLLTKTKKGQTKEQISHQHRIVFSYLQDKEATKELFTVVGPKIISRPGGYTRILKLGIRVGDNSEKAMIELVDFNDVYGKTATVATETAKKTRRGRAPKKAADENAPAVVEDAIEVKDDVVPEVKAKEEVVVPEVAPVIVPEVKTEEKSAE